MKFKKRNRATAFFLNDRFDTEFGKMSLAEIIAATAIALLVMYLVVLSAFSVFTPNVACILLPPG